MGRTGTGKGIARREVTEVKELPKGVKEFKEYYSFGGIKVSKSLLAKYKMTFETDNPFDMKFGVGKGAYPGVRERNVNIFAYDPATRELVVAPTKADHDIAIAAAGRKADYDRFVKGDYTEGKAKQITIFTDRFIPRRGKEVMDEVHETVAEMLRSFFPSDTPTVIWTYIPQKRAFNTTPVPLGSL